MPPSIVVQRQLFGGFSLVDVKLKPDPYLSRSGISSRLLYSVKSTNVFLLSEHWFQLYCVQIFLPAFCVLYCELLFFDLDLLVVDLNWKVAPWCTVHYGPAAICSGCFGGLVWSPLHIYFLLVPSLIVFCLG